MIRGNRRRPSQKVIHLARETRAFRRKHLMVVNCDSPPGLTCSEQSRDGAQCLTHDVKTRGDEEFGQPGEPVLRKWWHDRSLFVETGHSNLSPRWFRLPTDGATFMP